MSARSLNGRVGRAAAALLSVSFLLLAGCPLTEREYLQSRESTDDLAEKVARLERALAEVQRRPTRDASRGTTPDLQRGTAADAQLRKRVEDQGKSLADLRARVDEVWAQAASLLGRVETLEKGAAGEREAGRLGVSQLETRLSELDKKVQNLQTAVARPPEQPRQGAVSGAGEYAQPAAEKRSPPQVLYDEAYGLYRKQGKYDEAREKFKSFILAYPDTPLVPNAYFWIGESYYDQAQYEPAILEYDNVIKKFPKSDKVPSALLKQAFAFDALNDPVGAKALLKKLVRDYPKSDQAGIAQKKLDSLGD